MFWMSQGKRAEIHPRTSHEGPEGSRGIGQCHAPATLSPGAETRHPLYRRLGGPRLRSGQVQKISLVPGCDTRIVQSVASQVSRGSQMKLISTSMQTPTNTVSESGPQRIPDSLFY
jgi:hypothetical protein